MIPCEFGEILKFFYRAPLGDCLYNYSYVHNILRLFDGRANFPFTTGETMDKTKRDY